MSQLVGPVDSEPRAKLGLETTGYSCNVTRDELGQSDQDLSDFLADLEPVRPKRPRSGLIQTAREIHRTQTRITQMDSI